jgi:uncharacterized protein
MKAATIMAVTFLLLGAAAYAQADFYQLAGSAGAESVLAAIRRGADPTGADRLGVTPLMAAAASNTDPQVIVVLLAAGADINARDAMDMTPLMYAARANPSAAVVETLLADGAAVNDRDFFGETPLLYAARSTTNPEVVSALLRAGADAAVVARDGARARTLANANQHLKGSAALRALAAAGG